MFSQQLPDNVLDHFETLKQTDVSEDYKNKYIVTINDLQSEFSHRIVDLYFSKVDSKKWQLH